MIQVVESPGFKRAYKKLTKSDAQLRELFRQKLTLFIQNPFEPPLKTHKLSGRLRDSWSFSVTFDLRVVFTFVESNIAMFDDFGVHDDVY